MGSASSEVLVGINERRKKRKSERPVFVAPLTVVKNLALKKNKKSEPIRIHKIIGLPKPSEQEIQKIQTVTKSQKEEHSSSRQ